MQPFHGLQSTTGRRYLWTSCSMVLLLTGCDTPETQLAANTGVTPAIVIPCVDQQNVVGKDQSAYSEQRVFLEAQGWWGEKKANGTIPKLGAAEHLHVAMCFPLHQNVTGTLPFRVRMMGHNLPLNSVIQNTLLHDPDGANAFATVNWNITVTSTADIEEWRSASVNTTNVPSGWREFRILTQVRRPDGAEIHVSSGWCWHVSNTTQEIHSGTCASTGTRFNTMGRGWYDCFEYKIAETKNWQYPWSGINHGQAYQLSIGARDGAGDNPTFSRYEVRLDPRFHQGDNGDSLAAGNQAVTNQQITIGGNLLTAGIHRLVIIGSANPRCTTGAGMVPQDGEVSGVMSIPIKVN